MKELLEKIKASACGRLVIPEGRPATEELSRYKAYLKVETHRLLLQHRAGAGGLEICGARALMLDLLLQHLWEVGRATAPPAEAKATSAMALVAIGGYGRGELNPNSDIDFMFLHDCGSSRSSQAALARMVDAVLYPLWDVGLKVGHSVRTVEECMTQANSDMRSKTSLLEARLLAGNPRLFRSFEETLVKKCVQGREDDYIAERLADQKERRARFGNSASMQEPHIKSGCGGLRDYQNLLWMAFVKYRKRSLAELQQSGLIANNERKQLQAAYDYLLRVRTEMHYHTRRAVDVLGKSLQPAVAYNLGYKERSPSQRIENFMREVYTHSRNIYLITRTLEERLALLPRSGVAAGLSKIRSLVPARKPQAQVFDGFRFADGQIHAVSAKVFEEDPRRLMRVFLHAQQRGLRLHPDLARLIRNQISLADRLLLKNPHVHETFLTILNQRGAVAPVLRAMHEAGLLGRYIPEFGRLTCLVQHEFYHQYTTDEHTLMCIEQLDNVWNGSEPPHSNYKQLFQSLERPFILYLALLLHDVGKAESGRHAVTGASAALRTGKRLNLDAGVTNTLKVVIEHHMLMAMVSQRRDLDDPAVIRRFAQQVGNQETLAMLALHTFVDSQATSDKLWNGFKDSLLWTLFFKTMQLISGGAEFAKAGEKRREALKAEIAAQRPPFSAEEVQAHLEAMPARYFDVHHVNQILEDIALAHEFLQRQILEEEDPLAPVVSWKDELDRGFTTVKICTWDRAGLFRKIAGSLSALGLSILSAEVFTRSDGIVLDTFFVVDARTGNLPRASQQGKFQDLLSRALTSDEVRFETLNGNPQNLHRPYQAYSGEHMPTKVRFDNDSAEARTIVEVETEDRVGLLYTISKVLADVGLDISTAKISTERGAAIDSFYVQTEAGKKLTDPARQRQVEKRIREAIGALGDS